MNGSTGSFLIEVDPKTGLIESFGTGISVEPLFIAGALNGPIYLLSRRAVNFSLQQCLQDKGKRTGSNGAILTPDGFSGQGLFFDTDDEFEPTGMVVDSVYSNVTYIAGYFKVNSLKVHCSMSQLFLQ